MHKLFSSSTQLSMQIILLINDKMPTVVGILTFTSAKQDQYNICEFESKKYKQLKCHAQLS